jgi:hypothetical protein
MVEFLKITYLLFDGYVFPQIVSIAMGTDCAPLIADLILFSYETDFMREFLKNNESFL